MNQRCRAPVATRSTAACSYADGKLVFGTLDGYVIALDATTGKEVWVVKHAHPDKGETITPAPIIANDKVLIGFGGDEFAARGRFTAYDARRRQESVGMPVERAPTRTSASPPTPTRSIRNTARPAKISASRRIRATSGSVAAARHGAGIPTIRSCTSSTTSTGNPGLWSPSFRCGAKPQTQEACNNGQWDNKWSMTIFARNVDTGEAVWAYQMTPFDQWDYDGVNENILVDNLDVDGKKHKSLVHFDRNGFAYVLDRTDGTLLRANKYVTVNWAEKVDMKTGRPVKVAEHSPLMPQANTQACPSAMGGKDQQPASVDPNDPANFYVPTNNWCMELNPQERSHTQQGTVYVFANVYMYPEKPGITGKIKKFNVVTGKTEWEIADQYPNWGGTLTTAGGLVFYGSLGGDFRAVDRSTGKVVVVAQARLRHHRQPDPVVGRVARSTSRSVAGIGGWIGLPVTAGLDLDDKFGAIGATAMTKAAGLNHIPQGGTLYTFAVKE